MKKVSVFLISLFLFWNIYGECPDNPEQIIYDYYCGNKIDANEVFEEVKNCTFNKAEDEILWNTALSNIVSLTSDNTEIKNHLKDFEQKIKPVIKHTADANLIYLYSGYLYSKFSWEQNSFSIIEELPALYLKNKLLNGDKRAELNMAVWYSSTVSSNTPLWNAFLIQNEPLLFNLELTDVEKFNAYFSYAQFYFKTFNTEKGYFYFNLAREIFPNNILLEILKSNLKKGRVGL